MFATAEWGFAHRPGFWGSGVFVAAARMIDRLRVRDRRRPPARGARGGRQRPRQRRAGQARRRQGSDPAPELPAQRAAFRPGALVDRARRLASRQSRVGRGGSLMALIHRPTACAQAGIHSAATVTTSEVRKVSKGKDLMRSRQRQFTWQTAALVLAALVAFAVPVAAKPGSPASGGRARRARAQHSGRQQRFEKLDKEMQVALGPAAWHLQGDPHDQARAGSQRREGNQEARRPSSAAG